MDTGSSGLRITKGAAGPTHRYEDMHIADFTIDRQCILFFPGAPWSPQADGMLGLGFDNHTPFGDALPPFSNMVEQKLIDEPIFAFSPGSSTQPPSLTLGGFDSSRYKGEMTYLPLVEDWKAWEVQLDAIMFGKDKVEIDHTGAILDSGTALIALPSDLAGLFNKELGAKRNALGQYVIDCDWRYLGPNLTFTLAGHDFVVTPNEYVVEHGKRAIALRLYMAWILKTRSGFLVMRF